MKPNEIEKKSFEIIDQEAGPHEFDAQAWSIVRRMIHTSADFEYMYSIRIHPEAIAAGIQAIRSGCNVITDTEMARSGIRKTAIEQYGGKTFCLIGASTVVEKARDNGTTRAREAVDQALDRMENGIYVIGNAPTALLRLIEQIQAGKARPALVLGFPVGFVNAAESKSLLESLDYPYITNQGRKGGSNIAASVVNALIILAQQQDQEKEDR